MKKTIQKTLILIFAFMLCACGTEGLYEVPTRGDGPYIYYINSTLTGILPIDYVPRNTNSLNYEELLLGLSSVPQGEGVVAPLEGISVLSSDLADGKLNLEFGREYYTLTGTKEVLARAAVVKTLTQCADVTQVEFFVAGDQLLGSNGEPILAMDSNTFVEYFGKEQDALLSDIFTVYYATEDGSGLVREIHRVYYESNLPLEQVAIRCLREAPESRNSQSAINPNFKVINMTANEGTCYLDLDMSFYDENTNVNQTVSLMAIVNTLCELDGIRNVQVNIIDPSEESTTGTLIENLNGIYEKNTDLIKN